MAPAAPCAKKRLSGKTKAGSPRKQCPAGSRRDRRAGCDGYKTTRCRRSSSSGGGKSPKKRAAAAQKVKTGRVSSPKKKAIKRRESSSLKRVISCKSKLIRWMADYDIARAVDVVECKEGDHKKKQLMAVFKKGVASADLVVTPSKLLSSKSATATTQRRVSSCDKIKKGTKRYPEGLYRMAACDKYVECMEDGKRIVYALFKKKDSAAVPVSAPAAPPVAPEAVAPAPAAVPLRRASRAAAPRAAARRAAAKPAAAPAAPAAAAGGPPPGLGLGAELRARGIGAARPAAPAGAAAIPLERQNTTVVLPRGDSVLRRIASERNPGAFGSFAGL